MSWLICPRTGTSLRREWSYGLELMVERGTRLRAHSLLFLGQPDACPAVVAGARDAVDIGMSGLAAFVMNPLSSGEFGTSMVTQDVV